MGGLHEDTIKPPKSKKESDEVLAAPPEPETHDLTSKIPAQTQKVRHHLSGNEIHLHVDEENLKVAIPPVRLDMIIGELRERKVSERSYYDSKNKTIARFVAGQNDKGQFDIWLGVEKAPDVKDGPVIGKLDKILSKVAKKK